MYPCIGCQQGCNKALSEPLIRGSPSIVSTTPNTLRFVPMEVGKFTSPKFKEMSSIIRYIFVILTAHFQRISCTSQYHQVHCPMCCNVFGQAARYYVSVFLLHTFFGCPFLKKSPSSMANLSRICKVFRRWGIHIIFEQHYTFDCKSFMYPWK